MGLRLTFCLVLIAAAVAVLVDCKAFGPLTSRSDPDEVYEQVYDVANGRRDDFKINGNILNGDAEITMSYTNEEIMQMVAIIGGGILLALVCCCVCLKYCCCPSKPPTVIMYQQMPSAQPQQPQIHQRTALPGNNMIPMRNQGFSEMNPQFTVLSPPPPYPGVPA